MKGFFEMTKIFIANDHAGFALKNFLIQQNPQKEWEDLGVFDESPSSYPKQASVLCQRVLELGDGGLGVLICGGGQGMAMQANRFLGIRAGLCWDEESARLSRQHNNANVLCMGGRLISFEMAQKIFTVFIQTPFEGGRHIDRVKQLDNHKGCENQNKEGKTKKGDR